MNEPTPFFFLCNGANSSSDIPENAKITNLSYFYDDRNNLVNLQLPNFVSSDIIFRTVSWTCYKLWLIFFAAD